MINGLKLNLKWNPLFIAAVVVLGLALYTAPAKSNTVGVVGPATSECQHPIADAWLAENKGKELLVVEGQANLDSFHNSVFTGKTFPKVKQVKVFNFKNVVRIIGFNQKGCIHGRIDVYPHTWEKIKLKYKAALRGV